MLKFSGLFLTWFSFLIPGLLIEESLHYQITLYLSGKTVTHITVFFWILTYLIITGTNTDCVLVSGKTLKASHAPLNKKRSFKVVPE